MGQLNDEKQASVVGGPPSDGHSATEVEAGTRHSLLIDAATERRYRE